MEDLFGNHHGWYTILVHAENWKENLRQEEGVLTKARDRNVKFNKDNFQIDATWSRLHWIHNQRLRSENSESKNWGDHRDAWSWKQGRSVKSTWSDNVSEQIHLRSVITDQAIERSSVQWDLVFWQTRETHMAHAERDFAVSTCIAVLQHQGTNRDYMWCIKGRTKSSSVSVQTTSCVTV